MDGHDCRQVAEYLLAGCPDAAWHAAIWTGWHIAADATVGAVPQLWHSQPPESAR